MQEEGEQNVLQNGFDIQPFPLIMIVVGIGCVSLLTCICVLYLIYYYIRSEKTKRRSKPPNRCLQLLFHIQQDLFHLYLTIISPFKHRKLLIYVVLTKLGLNYILDSGETELSTSTIWIMGKKYTSRIKSNNNQITKKDVQKRAFPDMFSDIQSRLYFCYRTKFPAIMNSLYTNDVGWGCTIRSGQMMMAQALLSHYLGREWKISALESPPLIYYHVLKKFEDKERAEFSIHKIVQKGIDRKIQIGQWFGPTDIAVILRDLAQNFNCDVLLHVSLDGVINYSTISDLFNDNDGKGIVIIVPRRLGSNLIDSNYFNSIRKVFQIPQCIGAIGGKPRYSYYFIGYQDHNLLYFDPHEVRKAIDMNEQFNPETYPLIKLRKSSYQVASPQVISLENVDPSIAFGFYCRNERDFNEFFSCIVKLEEDQDCIFTTSVTPVSCNNNSNNNQGEYNLEVEDGFTLL